MRKIHILGLALCAVFAFSAVVATAALAGEWLVEGAAVAAELPAETEGTLELTNYETGSSETLLVVVLCSGILDGTVNTLGKGTVTDVLSLTEAVAETVGTLLTETGDLNKTALNCTVAEDLGLTDCETGLVEVWVDNLSLELKEVWTTSMELVGTETLGVVTGSGYEVSCKTLLGIVGENLCEGVARATLTNEAGTSPASVLGVFPALLKAERLTCTLTGTLTGEVRGSGNTWATNGTELGRLSTAVS